MTCYLAQIQTTNRHMRCNIGTYDTKEAALRATEAALARMISHAGFLVVGGTVSAMASAVLTTKPYRVVTRLAK